MPKIIHIIIFLLISIGISAQNSDGYWDKDRATKRETILEAGAKTWIRSDELPIGTTEFVYRITVLGEGQKSVDGLATALSMLPDPSGISKGSAIAISLMSTMSGNHNCYYSIFTSQEDADNYYKTGNYKTACYSHPNEITSEVNRISIKSSTCINENTRYIWFGFKSTNSFMDEKIVLEIVPWIDNKAARGWTNTIKTNVLENCRNSYEAKKMVNPDNYCLCLLEKLEASYKLQDYQKLIPAEQNKIAEEIGQQCLSDTGELNHLYNKERETANSYIARKQYADAINKYLAIIAQTTSQFDDYNNLGYCYILTKQYLKAIKYLKEGEKLDETDLIIKGNLAHAYLLSGDTEQAKTIYLKYKSQNINESLSWIDMVKIDFDDFRKVGIQSENFNEILNLIN
ncbi:tetratricopeptide repeat protein [Flavobacterium yafengii]|uniref:Tetratricopeptide repeat protein n=1 Tax=Flavobacterium yafengii TaxID=3041253 RepID=A0AAW6TQA7_9FLAO|nr:tetratricopeptide repeat protein [Flavobacterium yafengii]MDI5950298.1 tetratricopeptide repeat protein [Flavobacterium yafengii]